MFKKLFARREQPAAAADAASAGGEEPLLQLEGVRRSYNQGAGELEVLHGISLSIYPGEMVAIIGPSGSGKSTLMNIIGCLDTPTAGSYRVRGTDTSKLQPDDLATLRRDFFGFIFQRYHLLGHLSARENVEVPSIYAGVKKHKRSERSTMLLEQLGLGERVDYKPSQLSGGQQQRVSIARALMNGGQIILADEPTGALDTKSGAEVMKILRQLNDEGHTIILVTHDPKIAACAKRIISIEDGAIKSDRPNTAVDQGSPAAASQSMVNNVWAKTIGAFYDRFKEAFVMAWRAMIANRMRTLLTMLGIIIGIMAVVSVVALARGASEQIMDNISSLGTNTITIYPGEHMGDVRSGKVRTLTERDLNALSGQPFVDSASASVESSVLLRRHNKEFDATAQGVSADMFRVYGYEVARGRLFTAQEVTRNTQVCVLDSTSAENLFGTENPVGQTILVNTMPLAVIGVLEYKDSPFVRPDSLNVYLPYTAAMTRLVKQDYLSSIVIRVADGFSTAVAESSIVNLLKSRHGRQDFFIQSSDTIMKSISSATLTFTLLISAIAVISLVVGGIGVMNIMLVSVTERTREIGIRMAVGARQNDIMAQFLIEAVMVCLIGGFAGVVLTFVMAALVQYFFPSVVLSFSAWSVLAAVVTSSAIGIVFGFMPARSASRLDPIEALARE